ncbi:Ribosomal protein L30 [Giardia muris]|uniref:Ribosomal protein L30 n=1 Tax=Giardia muris TaxID=5742 RepID=A0A4Z1T5B7_GIAMU|nr:Ribosomal protein L30 [Giardia muris]|eukprot:TNJ27709.1 Ribosomal protein L30 [Giardia muris]
MATRAASRKTQDSISLMLTLVVKSGRYALGTSQAVRYVRDGKAKLVFMADNCPPLVRSQVDYLCHLARTPVHVYTGSSRELGVALGKQFNVSVFTVLEPGDADLTDLLKA